MSATINIDLEYRDFYNILEMLQKSEEEWAPALRERFLQRVFDLAAGQRAKTEWQPIKSWNGAPAYIRAKAGFISRKIQLIKDVRCVAPIGLKEAKDFVDTLSLEWRDLRSLGNTGEPIVCQTSGSITSLSEMLSIDGGHVFEFRLV